MKFHLYVEDNPRGLAIVRDLETLIKNSGSLKVICSGKIYAVYQDHVPEPFLEPHVVRFGHYMAAESAEDLLPAEALALRIMSGHLRQFVRTYDLMCTGAMSAANSGYPYVQH